MRIEPRWPASTSVSSSSATRNALAPMSRTACSPSPTSTGPILGRDKRPPDQVRHGENEEHDDQPPEEHRVESAAKVDTRKQSEQRRHEADDADRDDLRRVQVLQRVPDELHDAVQLEDRGEHEDEVRGRQAPRM